MLLKSADELKSFSKGEEELLEGQIKEIKEAGVSVVVSGEFCFCLELIDWFRFSNNWFALRCCACVGYLSVPCSLLRPPAHMVLFRQQVW